MNLVRPLTLLSFISALLTIAAEYFGPRAAVYLFKPLTTILILLIAVTSSGKRAPFYRSAIAVGLLCSLAGDVFLMLPSDHFLQGLVSFLLAHLCYIAAFTSKTGPRSSALLALPFALYAAAMFWILLPHVGALRWPVVIYGIVLCAMAWRACEMWRQEGGRRALFAFVGAALFVVSDSALAYNRFVGEFGSSRAMVLATYFAAQWLIARSV
jgi:uncharacterized membrane protein YhhN